MIATSAVLLRPPDDCVPVSAEAEDAALDGMALFMVFVMEASLVVVRVDGVTREEGAMEDAEEGTGMVGTRSVVDDGATEGMAEKEAAAEERGAEDETSTAELDDGTTTEADEAVAVGDAELSAARWLLEVDEAVLAALEEADSDETGRDTVDEALAGGSDHELFMFGRPIPCLSTRARCRRRWSTSWLARAKEERESMERRVKGSMFVGF
jgi:hypothetical protein